MPIISHDLAYQGNRTWKVTTAPSTELWTTDDFKTFARIDGDDEDDLIDGFIKTARELTEKYLGRALIEQSITLVMDWWPGVEVKLPRPPLISITSVATLDEDDTATTYSSSNYYTDTISEPGRLLLKQSVTHPYNTDRSYGGYRIIFKAGYGDEVTDVPQGIIDGVAMWAADIYENRIISPDPPPIVVALLNAYKNPRINY